ncbi:RT0821/Lpp0805 family surface protein [Pleomorphomonas sp. NRK KF1]|uniref:RT0821/Lpp0805 family surface protein n=1 Tax=Pleomorphomonas sp. NRK KF1 TaxID=2943000 RepID=UPI002043586E|nr:RT0821/Lpp0805 family surface protein [Pleomorphomonas sp. NRK KF1]MCM5555484.1 RT0821/Lpp0805 family surface protein [Pleomorphomonas sp. NRK KF1]
MLLKKLVIVGLAASMLAGCATGPNQNQTLGTLAGAVGGAAIGSAFGQGSGKVAAIAAGALVGGFLGNQIGATLDADSQRYNYNASVQALDSGYPQQWQNPQTGTYGTVQPGPVAYVNNRTCRPYTNTVFIDGQQQVVRGTACRNPDGSWQVVG